MIPQTIAAIKQRKIGETANMSSIWKYYQGVNAITFIIAITTLFAIAIIVIGVKVFAMARMNPVKSLKEE